MKTMLVSELNDAQREHLFNVFVPDTVTDEHIEDDIGPTQFFLTHLPTWLKENEQEWVESNKLSLVLESVQDQDESGDVPLYMMQELADAELLDEEFLDDLSLYEDEEDDVDFDEDRS